jgi:two-component system response regulator DegU
LLVDDHAMVRQGLRCALECYPRIEVVGEACDGEEAVTCVAKVLPTIVVIDIVMPKMDGIAATRLIKTQYPQIAVIGLTRDLKDYTVYSMKKAGLSKSWIRRAPWWNCMTRSKERWEALTGRP